MVYLESKKLFSMGEVGEGFDFVLQSMEIFRSFDIVVWCLIVVLNFFIVVKCGFFQGF